MAVGSIRERNGRFYIRTRVQVIDSDTGAIALEAGREGGGQEPPAGREDAPVATDRRRRGRATCPTR